MNSPIRTLLLLWLGYLLAGGVSARDQAFPAAPEFPDGLSWLNVERPLTLADLRGKVVILDFWTYGCINCIHVMEELERLKDRYGNQLAVIGVHSPKFDNEGNLATLNSILHRYERRDPVVNDPDYHLMRLYQARAWPTLAVIDPAGGYVGKVSGEGHEERLARAIDELLHRHRTELDSSPLPLKTPYVKNRGLLDAPAKIAVSADRVAISDMVRQRILIAGHDGKVHHVIGSGIAGLRDAGFTDSQFRAPRGLAFGENDSLYVADTGNHAIRRVDLKTRRVTTLAGTGKKGLGPTLPGNPRAMDLRSPWDLAVDNTLLYIAMAGDHRIWRMNLVTGRLEPMAGSRREGIDDGPFSEASFSQPSSLALHQGKLYVADAEASAIRELDLKKETVRTLLGTGLFDFGDRDGAFGQALLQHPLGVLHWDQNTLLLADTYNHKIKRLTLNKRQSETLLGSGRLEKEAVGEAVRMNEPGGLARLGNWLLIADTNNGRILLLDPETRMARTWPLRMAAGSESSRAE